jgi:hypothetical protein
MVSKKEKIAGHDIQQIAATAKLPTAFDVDLLHEHSAPKLMFFGDPHGDFEPVIAAVERFRPEAIVLLGDLQPRQPLHVELQSIRDLTQIWFIHGNHDTDSDADYDHLWGSELADRNLHGRVVEMAGYRVAGLGAPSPGSRPRFLRPSTCSASSTAAGRRKRSGAGASRAATGRASSATSTSQCLGYGRTSWCPTRPPRLTASVLPRSTRWRSPWVPGSWCMATTTGPSTTWPRA